MNPSPQAQWLQDYSRRLCGEYTVRPFVDYFIQDPQAIPSHPRNPFRRPAGTPFGVWFDSLDTARGQQLAAALGQNSGFFQEYLNWAPSVSNLFDLVSRLVPLLAHPETPEPFRQGLFPYVYSLCCTLEQQVALLKVHQVHAKHKGIALEGTWKALLT